MRINADFESRVVILPEEYVYTPSPTLGVDRMMLDRVGDEVARATSLVRYAPSSTFSSHTHNGGEEILVLDGTFGDEHGLYPTGTYIRNPIGSSHTPQVGPEGALIFVKLHQFDADDTAQFILNTQTASWRPGLVTGLSVMPLHQHQHESVALVKWAPNTQFQTHRHWGGEEIYVLDGVFRDEHGEYPKGTWIRSPHLSQHTPFTGSEGAVIYVKTGHLQEPLEPRRQYTR